MARADFPFFDADNHYYEATDAFTRHLDPSMAKRCMQWADVNGKTRLLVAGQVNRFIPNPTFSHVSKPGALIDYFRAEAGVKDMRASLSDVRPIEEVPEYRDRDARLALMDEQGMEATIMLPTLGVGMETALADDPEALTAAFTAFNRWLDEDWGFNHQDRIYGAPYIPLVDPDHAVAELEYALANNARVVLMRPGPVVTPAGNFTPGDSRHDAFWSRLEESGISLVVHGGDAGYAPYEQMWGMSGETEAFRQRPLKRLLSASPVQDWMGSVMSDLLFERFPGLRIGTIETGSQWVKPLLKKLKSTYVQVPTAFGEDPYESFLEHVWVSPFFEDDVYSLVDAVGVDRVLFGSDYPHVEGLADPAAFVDEIDQLDEKAIRKIMHDNARDLVTPR